MCGHCTERAALAERVRSLRTQARMSPDPLLSIIHLQEVRDWRQPAWLAAVQDDPIAPLVVMCRAWTEAANGGPADVPLDLLPARLRARLDAWRAGADLPEAMATAGAPPLHEARAELDAYLGGWLHLPERSGPRWNEATLHERLPHVSVALDRLVRHAPEDERLLLLAVSSPGAASPFSAIDLWLQRRALQALAVHRGIAFVAALLPHLRSGAVLALVLRGDLDHAALLALHEALRSQPDNGSEGASDLRTATALLAGAAPARSPEAPLAMFP